MRKSVQQFISVAGLIFGSSAMAHAQYSVTFLQPSSFTSSEAHGIGGSNQAGFGLIGGSDHALLWSGTAASMLDLNPSGASQSQIWGSMAGKQFGYATFAGSDHAMMWSGTAASTVDLNPSGFTSSHGRGISATNQVGDGTSGFGSAHAMLWTGTAASAVDLNPTGFQSSSGWATTGARQIGYGLTNSGFNHGILWSGTAASAVDLNPSGFTETYAAGIGGNQEVGTGYGTATGNRNHAIMWTGSAASMVDLNPSGFLWSQAWATTGTQELGWAWNNSSSPDFHAFIWSGTAGSGVNLHSFLPANYSTSLAFAIDGATGNIVGLAHNTTLNRDEAVMWSPVPEPSTIAALGILSLGLIRRRRSALEIAQPTGRALSRPGPYSAFESYCIAPTKFPPGSWKKHRCPILGKVHLGMTICPPFASIARIAESISSTAIVHSNPFNRMPSTNSRRP